MPSNQHLWSVTEHIPREWFPEHLGPAVDRHERNCVGLDEFSDSDPLPKEFATAANILLTERQRNLSDLIQHLLNQLDKGVDARTESVVRARLAECRVLAVRWAAEIGAAQAIMTPYYASDELRKEAARLRDTIENLF